MKDKFLEFVKIYIIYVWVFVLQKPLFLLWYFDLYRDISFVDFLSILGHGLKLDSSMAGMFTVLPGIFLILSVFCQSKTVSIIKRIYFAVSAFIISIVFVSDLALYRYWGFRLNSIPLFYLRTPKNAMASTDWQTVLLGVFATLIIAVSIYGLFHLFIFKSKKEKEVKNKLKTSLSLLFLCCTLVLPIRGSIGVSTMNVGKVYFSTDMRLNHAAINPLFNFLDSIFFEENFSSQYNYFTEQESQSVFTELVDVKNTDFIPQLFNTDRPNIILFILESFSSNLIEPLHGIKNITPNINTLAKEGILFTNFYANAFRTDRGITSILNGYPAQPTTSIMKFPRKTQTLPSIPKTLKKEGYNLKYYYGGDADFTNMRSFLRSCGIDEIVSETDFPLSERISKWGVPDATLLRYVTKDLQNKKNEEPFFLTIQTSSSHEPFDVPIHKLEDPFLNSVFYTDSCIGEFMREYKKTEYWKNTVVVLIADHATLYPSSMLNESLERYQIPLLFLGGAVRDTACVDTYASQMDLAATILSQLNINHDEYTFSKNIFNSKSPHFAWFVFPNIFGFVEKQTSIIFNCDTEKIIYQQGVAPDVAERKGKAFLQVLYNDLGNR